MAAVSIANQPTVSMVIRDTLQRIEIREARLSEHDLGPVKIEAEVDDRLTEGQLGQLSQSEQTIRDYADPELAKTGRTRPTRRQVDSARHTVRRIQTLRRDMVLRQEIAVGVLERVGLEKRRGVEVARVGEVYIRFPMVAGERDGLLTLFQRGKLLAADAMAGIAYRGLWTDIEHSLRSSVAEIVTAGKGRPGSSFDALAADEERRKMLTDIDQMLMDHDEEGEALHLVHWVARDGFSLWPVCGGGGKQFDRKASILRYALALVRRRMDTLSKVQESAHLS